MAIALVSTAGNHSTSGSVIVNQPVGGWNNGDVLVAVVSSDVTSSTAPNTPATWTSIDSDPTDSLSRAMQHVCGGSEPSSYTFTTSGASPVSMSAIILDYSGVDNSTPINAHSIHAGNNKTATATGITTTLNGCQILALIAADIGASGATFATPSTFALEVADAAGSGGTFHAYTNGYDLAQGTAGSITPGNSVITTTASAANTFWGYYSIGLAPASTPSGIVFRRTASLFGTRAGSRQVMRS